MSSPSPTSDAETFFCPICQDKVPIALQYTAPCAGHHTFREPCFRLYIPQCLRETDRPIHATCPLCKEVLQSRSEVRTLVRRTFTAREIQHKLRLPLENVYKMPGKSIEGSITQRELKEWRDGVPTGRIRRVLRYFEFKKHVRKHKIGRNERMARRLYEKCMVMVKMRCRRCKT